ncbi:MAG: glycosyltransferase family 2 protein [Roseiflexus sp.]|nr:glycosyltransferase family 2 protein [Roseiflexus sp.]MCS7291114.1 glycosyltransferase family 2 protein [Roseiflexus sp.]
MSQIDVTVILVNWNGSALLERALTALFTTTHTSTCQVVVVDNASSDDSVAMVRRQFPGVTLLVNEENVGFGRANNQALALAEGRYILLLNTDAFVHDGAVDGMVAFMDAHPDAGSVGCRLYYEDGSLQRSCFAFPTLATELWNALFLDKLFPKSRFFGRYQMTYWDMNDIRPVDSLMGACLMVRTDVVKRIGLFDEQFFMYSEEIDLCYRLQQEGFKNYYLPTVSATHLWGGSSRRIRHESFLRLYQSRVKFFRKHYGERTAQWYKAILSLSSLIRVLAGGLINAVHYNPVVHATSRDYMALLRVVWAF